MNKKGWLRIIEVTLAVVLIIGSVFIFYQDRTVNVEGVSSDYVYQYFDEAFSNEGLREKIYIGDPDAENDVKTALLSKMNMPGINMSVSICDANVNCVGKNLPTNPRIQIASLTKMISTGKFDTLGDTSGNPKKVKIYVWIDK